MRLAMLGLDSWCWDEIENKQSNVVVLRALTCAGGPAAQLEQQRVGELRGRRRRAGEKFLQARFAEFFARGVHRFQDSIGVKKDAGAGVKWNFHVGIRCFRKEAEH